MKVENVQNLQKLQNLKTTNVENVWILQKKNAKPANGKRLDFTKKCKTLKRKM